jgi:two-component system response regulator FixJ
MKKSAFRTPVTVNDEKLAARCARGRVVVIDDDPEILSSLAALFEIEGFACETYLSAVTYLQVLDYNRPCFRGPVCVLCDVAMPDLSGLELQERLAQVGHIPLLLMSGSSGVREAVHAFRAGVLDFLVKPLDADLLLVAVTKALAINAKSHQERREQFEINSRIASLTVRERQVACLVTSGKINRAICEEMAVSLRTVKLYRQRVMQKLGAATLADLVRIADQGGLSG